MKQRITYFRREEDAFDPQTIRVDSSSIQVASLRAAKEHRLTLGLSEIPQELSTVLEQLHELHLRWVSPKQAQQPTPLAARLPPGLHAFVTPDGNSTAESLCPTLQALFAPGEACLGLEKSFSRPRILGTRFTSSPSQQYHANVYSFGHVALHLQQRLCPRTSAFCQDASFSLFTAQYIDIDYDAISRAVVLTGFWETETWTEKLLSTGADSRVEVGILSDEKAVEVEELSLGGWLTVMGEDEKPSPTLFSFPARHRPTTDGSYSVAFRQPTGLHPTMLLRINHSAQVPTPPWEERGCGLHAYMTLPSYLFIDEYQFRDSLFLEANKLESLRTISGAMDLEAPDYAVTTWGSAALFELKHPTIGGESAFEVSIPMHLRYLAPARGGYTNISVPWPAVFWACRADEGTKMPVNPFDRRQLGFDALFGERTAFFHLDPAPATRSASLIETIRVPVLDSDKGYFVQGGTSVVVLLGLLWTLWQFSRHRRRPSRDKKTR